MHQLPPYRQLHGYSDKDFPVAVELSRKGINLPSSTKLSREDIEFVCGAIAEISGAAAKSAASEPHG